MKKAFLSLGVFLLLLCNYPVSSYGQSMRSLFVMLPDECTPGLDKDGRRALVEAATQEYVVPGHSQEEVLDYSIDTVTANYLAYEYSNKKGRGRNVAYEIKEFKMSGGKYILLFSKNSDTRSTSNKYESHVYNINFADSSLIKTDAPILPQNLNYSVFLKSTTPEAIKDSIKKTSLCTFDLDIESPGKIIFYIVLESDKDEKWLAGNIMVLTWTGTTFKGVLSFQKEN